MINLKNTKINCMNKDGTINKTLVDKYTNACISQGITSVCGQEEQRAFLFCCDDFDLNYSVEWMDKQSLDYFNTSPEKEIAEADLVDITMEQMMAFIGSDQKPVDYLFEILTGRYTQEQFIKDVLAYE